MYAGWPAYIGSVQFLKYTFVKRLLTKECNRNQYGNQERTHPVFITALMVIVLY